MKQERGQSVQVIVVQAWDLELQNKTTLQGKRLNQQNLKIRGNAIFSRSKKPPGKASVLICIQVAVCDRA